MRISDWSSDVCSSDLRPRIENHSSTGAGADGLERHSTGEVPLLIHGFKKWPKNQKIALPILTIFAFGRLFNQLQGRQSEPTSIFVDNPRIIDGDTTEAADEKRVRLLGIDAPDDDGNGNVTKIAEKRRVEKECVSTCRSRWST